MLRTGSHTGIGSAEFKVLRQEIEDMIGFDADADDGVESETVDNGIG